jgi:hypothetical protein
LGSKLLSPAAGLWHRRRPLRPLVRHQGITGRKTAPWAILNTLPSRHVRDLPAAAGCTGHESTVSF